MTRPLVLESLEYSGAILVCITSRFVVFVKGKYADDAHLPAVVLKVPLLHILGSLKSEKPVVRQLADSWLRAYPKTYLQSVPIKRGPPFG